MTAAPLIAIVGAGPGGLMAAEAASLSGARVVVFDAMPSAGRKFLLAGRGGLNLTHSEPRAQFLERYSGLPLLADALAEFDAAAVRGWARGLGIDTFVGTSGRVFPTQLKAAPLLRAWLHRLRDHGVELRVRHRLTGLSADNGRWAAAVRDPGGCGRHQCRRRGARARRWQLAATRLGWFVGGLARRCRCADRAIATVELRVRVRLERTLAHDILPAPR